MLGALSSVVDKGSLQLSRPSPSAIPMHPNRELIKYASLWEILLGGYPYRSQRYESNLIIVFPGPLQRCSRDYENKTGIKLADDPFAKKFENCDSVDSITAILQEQAQIFRKFRGDDGKLMKSLKASVDVLYTFLTPFLRRYRSSFPACERNIRWHRHPTCRSQRH
ncbi:hypothetical protein BJV77DRAFT_239263 [Russula vinacea]|nr:hypothetical protein BJV77DRAFT_239263 [Russula vinacea]